MISGPKPATNADQIDYWNAAGGDTWTRFQTQLDRQLEPLGRAALAALAPRKGEHLLDIGCGCGQTTWDLAARVGAEGSVLGIDISQPMLEVAGARPSPVAGIAPGFRALDAQTGDLGHGVFDAAFSRFGVMFFADPIAAFANIRRSLKVGGRLAFVCWRPLAENPWMVEPLTAALPHLPVLPPSDPGAPGPYAFADAARVRAILEASGFGGVTITPFDAPIGGSDLAQTLEFSLRVGPLGAALRQFPERRGAVISAVEKILSRNLTPGGVFMGSAVWIVQARQS